MQVGARKHGAGIADVWSLRADIDVVLVGQQIGTGGVHAALYRWRSTRKEKHDVPAELSQLALVARAEALAHPHQQKQRPHAPRNPEHRQERAQLVRPQVAEDLREDVQNRAHNRETFYRVGRCTIDTSDSTVKHCEPSREKKVACFAKTHPDSKAFSLT